MMQVQSCCFANINLFFFAVAVAVIVAKVPAIVVIQKFCYHGNRMSHFSSLLAASS